jgi:hypothetical protein
MRQLLDLARENAVLKEELTRIRQEAQMLQRVLSSGVNSAQDTTGASEPWHGSDWRSAGTWCGLPLTGARWMTADELLVRLRRSKTDLGRFVEVMLRDELPHLVVPAAAVRAWEKREPQTWAMVLDWLAEQGKSVVQV